MSHISEKQTPVRSPKAHAMEREKLPQEKEAAPRTAKDAGTREALHVCSAQRCHMQGLQPLLGKAVSLSFFLYVGPEPTSPVAGTHRSQAHPSECITVVTGDPRARLIWDVGFLCGHRTDIPWRQSQWAGVVAALPPTERGLKWLS